MLYKSYAFLTRSVAAAAFKLTAESRLPTMRPTRTAIARAVAAFLALTAFLACLPIAAAQTQTPAAQSKVRAVGTIKSISGSTVTVTTDAGTQISILLQPATRLVRMMPGQADLKTATPLRSSDLEAGDRLLAGGTAAEDGKSVIATSVVVMKKADIAARQEREREDWQQRGVGGVVKSVDPRSGTVVLSTGSLNPNSPPLAVHVSPQTIIRRYAPDSVKFDDAKPGRLDQIKPGDQLRARGTKSAEGKELSAEEIVSGTFRNIAGTVAAIDAGNSTLAVIDLATKKPVTLRITSDSQLHKLPPMIAQRIAMRLKGGAAGGPEASAAGGGRRQAPARQAQPGGDFASRRPGGAPDFQQMLNRMPPVGLSELQKGEAVMIVATEGSTQLPSTAIILLCGVEPILTAAPSQAGMILSPWNLSSGENIGTSDSQ
jgi:hypothetical protein